MTQFRVWAEEDDAIRSWRDVFTLVLGVMVAAVVVATVSWSMIAISWSVGL